MFRPRALEGAIWPVFCDTYWRILDDRLQISPPAGSDLVKITPHLDEYGTNTLCQIGAYWAGMVHAHNDLDIFLVFYHMHNCGRATDQEWPSDDQMSTWLYKVFMSMCGHGVWLGDDGHDLAMLEYAMDVLGRDPGTHPFNTPVVDQYQWLGAFAEHHARMKNKAAFNKAAKLKGKQP